MIEQICESSEQLVDLVYDEGDPVIRARLEAHVASCEPCASELADLRGVRTTLRAWTPPEMALGFRIVRDEPAPRSRWNMPAWGLAAAATLVLAAGAGLAHLEVRYGGDGLVIRTGWTSASASPSSPVAVTASDLSAVEDRLRAEFEATAARTQPAAMATQISSGPLSDAEVLRRVRALITESESRQDRELALRLTQVVRDFDRQRQSDLVRIQAGFGQIQGLTGAEVARQRETINYLMRVSSQQRQ